MFIQSSRAESAAELLPLLHHEDVRVREGVAALLEQEHDALATEVSKQASWREKSLVNRRTLAALDGAGPEIAQVLGSTDRTAARETLLAVFRAANEI